MHASIRWVLAALLAGSCATFGCQSAPDHFSDTELAATGASVASEPMRVSFQAGGRDRDGHFLGGTETVHLTGFHGKLYAGTGYWTDKPEMMAERRDPASGPQVIVLDARNGAWREDVCFCQRDATFPDHHRFMRVSQLKPIRFNTYDPVARGRVVSSVELLAAGLDGQLPWAPDTGTSGALFVRSESGAWHESRLPAFSRNFGVRTFAVHYDSVENVDKLFIGVGTAFDGKPASIYAGTYDPTVDGTIRWTQEPDVAYGPKNGRVMAMGEDHGVLYAFINRAILRRDDRAKTWVEVASFAEPGAADTTDWVSSGLRAMTFLTPTDGTGQSEILGSIEGAPGQIFRVDPRTGRRTDELVVDDLLAKEWALPDARAQYVLAGYNDMAFVRRDDGQAFRLIGLYAPQPPMADKKTSAWFLSRSESNGHYALHEIKANGREGISSNPALVSVRAIAVSPFPEDEGQAVYMGGFDGAWNDNHNTAWIVRMGLTTATRDAR